MSSNIFGIPVNDVTVLDIYPNLNPNDITARHRAEVALINMNANDRATLARDHAAGLKSSWGNGTSTLACIYNATGGTVRFVSSQTWEGSVWRDPYPQVLQNGQWGAFLHVRGRLMGPSKEGIVYRGQNAVGNSRDWVLAWDTTRMNYQNFVYTEIRAGGSTVNWNAVNRFMSQQGLSHSVTTLGCYSTVSIGSGSSPHYVAIMTLDGLTRDTTALASDISAIFPSLDSEHKDDEGVVDEGVVDEGAATAATATAEGEGDEAIPSAAAPPPN